MRRSLGPTWLRSGMEIRRSHLQEQQQGAEYVKRDLWMWKETYICEKRRIYLGLVNRSSIRELSMAKETYICEKRHTYVQRDIHMWKETYLCEKRHTYVKRDIHMWKETYLCAKRPTYLGFVYWYRSSSSLSSGSWVCQKRYVCEKRPMYVKRDLYM